MIAISTRRRSQPENSGLSPAKGRKYGKTMNAAIVTSERNASKPNDAVPWARSAARNISTIAVSHPKLKVVAERFAYFGTEITFSMFLDKNAAKALKKGPIRQIFYRFFLSPGLLNCLYATRNSSDSAFAVSGERFLSARR